MEFLEMNHHQFTLPHHDQRPQHHYTTSANSMFGYTLTHSNSAMAALASGPKTETKPRLGKDEVDILEREFQKNSKPTTQTKRGFAEDMGVDLARINNWFQNRRAKRKQEKKQEAYEAAQVKEAQGLSESSSPDYFANQGAFDDDHVLSQQQSRPSSASTNGPPPAVASYNPQYSDPTGASIESLQRTMAMAQATQQNDFHHFGEQDKGLDVFGAPVLLQDLSHIDRAQFPSVNESLAQFDTISPSFDFTQTFSADHYNASMISLPSSGSPSFDHASIQLSGTDIHESQHLTSLSHDGLQLETHDSINLDSSHGTPSIGFNMELVESNNLSVCPPAPSSLFKSPPPPTDIASRRKKVQNKPAALDPDAMRGRPSVGPRTVSQAEGFRQRVASPITSPMRRIVSAGGNRNVLSGRIQKQCIDSAQRSPRNFHAYPDVNSFMESNHHNIRFPSALYSSLAPPTPMSPRERDNDTSGSSASPPDLDLNYSLTNGAASCMPSIEQAQILASPPETPQANLMFQQSSSSWPNGNDVSKTIWSFDVQDQPQFTPGLDSFPSEQLSMPQPAYLMSNSQPVTPGFNHLNSPSFDMDSPHIKHESPQYMPGSQGQIDFSSLEAQYPHGLYGLSDAMVKQKTFQFSNSTPADFTEK